MKRIVKYKLLPVVIFAVIWIFLFVFLYHKGFRITYAPDLENSWNAVSAFAAWGGVFMSLLAIIAAGIVAWRQNNISREQNELSRKQADITDKQNKIALFEKRFEIYDILFSCKTSAEDLKPTDRYEDILKQTVALIAKSPDLYRKFNRDEATLCIISYSTKLNSAAFFFSDEVSSYLIDASIALLTLATAGDEVDKSEEYNKKIQNYFTVMKELDSNGVLENIEKEMKIM